jgi:hypothetical protein
MKRILPASLAAVLALGFAGSALADRDHDRHDRDRYDRYERNHRQERYERRDRYDHYDRSDRYRDARPRQYYYAPRYDRRYRAPAPRGWYPGWREPYGRGYRYWNDNYYYVVPAQPALELSFVLPLR